MPALVASDKSDELRRKLDDKRQQSDDAQDAEQALSGHAEFVACNFDGYSALLKKICEE